jgi:hypothetical protein
MELMLSASALQLPFWILKLVFLHNFLNEQVILICLFWYAQKLFFKILTQRITALTTKQSMWHTFGKAISFISFLRMWCHSQIPVEWDLRIFRNITCDPHMDSLLI